MREICQSGLEGGGAVTIRLSLPLSSLCGTDLLVCASIIFPTAIRPPATPSCPVRSFPVWRAGGSASCTNRLISLFHIALWHRPIGLCVHNLSRNNSTTCHSFIPGSLIPCLACRGFRLLHEQANKPVPRRAVASPVLSRTGYKPAPRLVICSRRRSPGWIGLVESTGFQEALSSVPSSPTA